MPQRPSVWEPLLAPETDCRRSKKTRIQGGWSASNERALLEEVLRYPEVPTRWRTCELGVTPSPLLTVAFRKEGRDLRFFSTIAAFATPRDEIALTQSGWVRASAALIAGWTALSMAASLRVLEIATAGSPESALKQELVDIPVSHALAVRVAHRGSLPRGIASHGEAHRTV